MTRLQGAARIGAVLDRLGSVAPGPAQAALAEVIERLGQTPWPEVAWRWSRLTDDGFPLEFAWSSRDAALRWTAEVAGPEVSGADRLGPALDLARALGGAPVALPPDLSMSGEGFGCWLGARHDAAGTRVKLYLAAESAPDHLTRAVAEALGRGIRWRMLGWEPATGRREWYGRLPLAGLHEPAVLARRLGLAEPGRLTQALAALLPEGPRPLGRHSGLSLSLDPGGAVEALCWFGPPQRLHPRPEAAVRRLIAAAEGHDTRLLCALAAGGEGRLGMVGLGLAGGAVWLQAGWRP